MVVVVEVVVVVDVGVGPGTPWLYEAFPSARFELFEAIDSFRPEIEQATRGLDAGLHFCALGEAPSTLIIEFNRATPTSSLQYCRFAHSGFQLASGRVTP